MDHRSHFGTEHRLLFSKIELGIELRHRFHHLNAIVLLGESFIDL